MSDTTVPPLSQLYFYLTEGCNLACRHCWLAPVHESGEPRRPILDSTLFRTAIEEALPLGLTTVKLTGGEPCLHPKLSELIEIIRAHDLGVTFETNGVLLTADIVRNIAKCRNAFISISLDGADAATHDWMRGVAGSFEKAVRAVSLCVECGIAPQIIMSLTRRNVEQIDAIVKLAEHLGVESIKFNLIQPAGRGSSLADSETAILVPEIIELGRRVDTTLQAETTVRLIFDYPAAFVPLRRFARPQGCGTCGILGIMGVLASGHYALCGIGQLIPELTFGKAGTDRLADVWRDAPVLRELRDGMPQRLTGICGECIMKWTCQGACIAQNYYSTHALWAPHWFCIEAEKAGVFPASRLEAVEA